VADDEPRQVDTSQAYSARVNNYWQGGKDNFAADREAALAALEAFPQLPTVLRQSAAFRRRAIGYLAAEAGLRQFIDLGTGLPAEESVHAIAQSHAQDSRVVYVDNDPMVIVHAAARPAPKGSCGYVEADVRDAGGVLRAAAETLDLGKPVALVMSALLHLITDDAEAYPMVREYLAAVPSGSYLVIVHPSSDLHPDASKRMSAELNQRMKQQRRYRDHAGVARFFDGLEFVSPGLVPAPRWRPESEMAACAPTLAWAGVARKP
jgi:hypothetical protein